MVTLKLLDAVHDAVSSSASPRGTGAERRTHRGRSTSEQEMALRAGCVRVLRCCRRFSALRAQAAAPIVHCRDLNPYIDSALADWRKSHGKHGQLPRVAGTIACGSIACAAGVR